LARAALYFETGARQEFVDHVWIARARYIQPPFTMIDREPVRMRKAKIRDRAFFILNRERHHKMFVLACDNQCLPGASEGSPPVALYFKFKNRRIDLHYVLPLGDDLLRVAKFPVVVCPKIFERLRVDAAKHGGHSLRVKPVIIPRRREAFAPLLYTPARRCQT